MEKISLQLKDLNTVTIELQDETTTLTAFRTFFDLAIDQYNLSENIYHKIQKFLYTKI